MEHHNSDSDGEDDTRRDERPADGAGGSPGSSTWPVEAEWNGSRPPSIAIVEGIATATETQVTDLPPLQRTLDPEALDTLLTGPASAVELSFTVDGVAVTVESEGQIELRADDRAAD